MAIVVKGKTWNAGDAVVNTDVNGNFDTLYNDYNGNVNDSNFSAAPAVQSSRILNTAATLTGAAEQAITQPTKMSLLRYSVQGNSETVASATNMALITTVLLHIITGTTTVVTLTGGIEGQLAFLLITGNMTITHTGTDVANNIHTKTQANKVITASAANPALLVFLCTKLNGNWANLQWIEL